MSGKPSKLRLVARLLREAGDTGVTTAEFLEAGCGSRFGARIQQLRDGGLTIDSRRVRDGSWRYTLRTEASAAEPSSSPDEVSADTAPAQLFEAAGGPANVVFHWEAEAA